LEIYAEYLFMENFITGVLILLLTGRICGKKIRRKNLIEGGMLCGIYSFVLFFDNMGYLLSIFCKIFFSIVVVVSVFELWPESGIIRKNLLVREMKTGGRILLTFYLTSFAMGGITIAAMYFFSFPGVTNNGSVYLMGVSYINVVFGVAISYVLIDLFAKFVRRRVAVNRDYRDIAVELNGKSWNFKALVDTANFLREPITGKPVAIICKSAASLLLINCPPERFCIIPYKGIGKEGGIMEGFRADIAVVSDVRIEKPVFAIYDGEFNVKNKTEDYQILLHRELIEGGIATNV